MTRAAARARKKPAPTPNGLTALVAAWWDMVVAGEADEPHPIHGELLSVRLDGGRLKLAGEVESKRDRDELVRQARDRIGHGITDVDASGLKVAARKEKPGLLDQTIVAAFPNRATAQLALKFVIERSRIVPKRQIVLAAQGAGSAARSVPSGFAGDIRKHLDDGHAVLILQVDETEVFRVRGLLEEDTRSIWTITTPPEVAA
jgi:hypothetical protein